MKKHEDNKTTKVQVKHLCNNTGRNGKKLKQAEEYTELGERGYKRKITQKTQRDREL